MPSCLLIGARALPISFAASIIQVMVSTPKRLVIPYGRKKTISYSLPPFPLGSCSCDAPGLSVSFSITGASCRDNTRSNADSTCCSSSSVPVSSPRWFSFLDILSVILRDEHSRFFDGHTSLLLL